MIFGSLLPIRFANNNATSDLAFGGNNIRTFNVVIALPVHLTIVFCL